MKSALKKKIPKYVLRFLELLVTFVLSFLIMATATTAFQFILGLAAMSATVSVGFIFTLREILYWAAYKDEPDGWEGDLTNQS